MAGIGLELERLFDSDTFVGDFIAHAGAGVVLAGSWMFGIFSIAIIFLASFSTLSRLEQLTLFTMITYANAMGMLITSFLSLPLTRFIADRFYLGDIDSMGPNYVGATLLHLAVGTAAGGLFYAVTPLSPTLKLLGVLLTVAYTHLWLASSFVSVLRAYILVITTSVAGYSVSTLGALWLGRHYGLAGYLGGFAAGIAFIGAALTALLTVKLSFVHRAQFGFLTYVRSHSSLVLVGFFLAAGVWVDKLMFWISGPRVLRASFLLRSFPDYDMSFFMGYISAVPALSWMLLMVETTFARSVFKLYSSLSEQRPYDLMHAEKVEMVNGMNANFWGVLKVQAPVTLLTLYFAPAILEKMQLPSHLLHMFRFSVIAAVGIALLQSQVLYLLYFDQGGRAVIPSVLYFAFNAILTRWTIHLGPWSYGLGNLLAAFIAAAAGAVLVGRSLPRLEHLVLRDFGRLSMARNVRAGASNLTEPAPVC